MRFFAQGGRAAATKRAHLSDATGRNVVVVNHGDAAVVVSAEVYKMKHAPSVGVDTLRKQISREREERRENIQGGLLNG